MMPYIFPFRANPQCTRDAREVTQGEARAPNHDDDVPHRLRHRDPNQPVVRNQRHCVIGFSTGFSSRSEREPYLVTTTGVPNPTRP